MADTNNLTNFLGDVADAIRAKTGNNDPIPAANFDTEIANIATGTELPDGIYIQNLMPTKNTTEAFWLYELSGDKVSDLIPPETMIGGSISFGQIKSALIDQNLLNDFDAAYYHVFATGYGGNHASVAFSNNAYRVYSSYGANYAYVGNGTDYVWACNFSYNNADPNHLVFNNQGQVGYWSNANYQSWGIDFCDKDILYSNGVLWRAADELNTYQDGLSINVGNEQYVVYQSEAGINTFDKILNSQGMNATSNDIIFGKTAVANNQKLTGTIQQNSINITPSMVTQTIDNAYYTNSTVLSISESNEYENWTNIAGEVLNIPVVPIKTGYKIFYHNSMNDLSNNMLNGTLTGAYTVSSNGIIFNGGYGTTGIINSSTGTWEIGGIINSDFIPANYSEWYICSCIMGCELGGQQRDFGIILSPQGYVGIGYSTQSTSYSNIKVNDGRYHHYTLTVSTTQLLLYVDGVLAVTVNYSQSGDTPSTFGIYWNNTNTSTYINGIFNIFRYYTEILTIDEIVNNYKAGVNGGIYTELEYVEFTGTQYINTSVIPSNHQIDIKFDFLTYNNDEHLFGTDRNDSSLYYHFTSYSNKYFWGYNGTEGNGGTWSTGIHTLVYDGDNHAVILDNNILTTGTNIASTAPILLGRRGPDTNFTGRIYYCKIWDKSTNTLVRYLIPVKDNNGIVCMYDKVNDTYYHNQGSGNFIAGPEMRDLTHSLNAILQEKITKIVPENIANGVTIFDITGNFAGGEDLSNVLNEQDNLIANLQNQINILNTALDNAAGGGSIDYNSRYSDEMNTLNVFSSYIANDTFDYMYHNFDPYDSSVTYPNNIIPWHAFRYYNNVPLNNIFDASIANGVYFLINYDLVGYNIDSFWVEINTANGCFDIYLSATDPEISRNIANGTIFANLDFENQQSMEFQYIPIPNTNNIGWCLKGYDSNIGEDTYQELNYEGFCDMCKVINRYEDTIIADNAWSSTSVSLAYNAQSMNTRNWIYVFNNPNLDVNMIPIISNEISKMLTIGLVNIS